MDKKRLRYSEDLSETRSFNALFDGERLRPRGQSRLVIDQLRPPLRLGASSSVSVPVPSQRFAVEGKPMRLPPLPRPGPLQDAKGLSSRACRRSGSVVNSDSFSDAKASENTTEESGGHDDLEDGCCAHSDLVITADMSPEQIEMVKKARRKEQCRVNQANYRRRKRAIELQMSREIMALQDEIEELRAQRSLVRRHSNSSLQTHFPVRDPLEVVHEVYVRLTPTHKPVVKQTRAPLRQVDAVVGLEHEEFASVEELLGQWRFHRSVFEVFELRLRSVRHDNLHTSLVVIAEATLQCSIFARNRKHEDGQNNIIVTCPVVQRFVFDENHRKLAKIISEVDWIPGLWQSSSSPLQHASDLVMY